MDATVSFPTLRRYAVTYFSVIVGFALVAGVGFQLMLGVFLWRSGELAPVAEIVRQQMAGPTVYGSAMHEDGFDYKLELVAAAKPAVIALGSSRVLQFRQSFFSSGFINAGRAMNNPEEGLEFMQALAPRHKPKVVIIGADFWWFNPNWRYAHRPVRNTSLNIAMLHLVESWVWDGKVTVADVWRVAVLGERGNDLTRRPNVGVAAIKRGNGYRPDGSRDYGLRYSGGDPTFDDAGFANSLSRIDRGDSQFEYAGRADRERIAGINRLLEYLTARGMTPIVVMPPLARRVLDKMATRGADYGYFADMGRYAASLKTEAYDFTEPESLGADDCEFVDGFHGGEVVYQRILAEIVRQNPQSVLAAYVDGDELGRSIQAAAGHALTRESAGDYALAEEDFLKIGCRK